jgi:hypothetical protein
MESRMIMSVTTKASSTAQSSLIANRNVEKLFASNQPVVTNIKKVGILRQLLSNHLLIFLLFVFTKSYILSMWFGNIYLIQKAASSRCIFYNGMILGSVDLFSFIFSGFISKRFDRYNSQCFQVILSFVLVIGKLVFP